MACTLEIDPDQIKFIPANVEAQIRATTVFGAKFVDLIYPTDPSAQRLAPARYSRRATSAPRSTRSSRTSSASSTRSTPAKLNSVLTALAEGVRGQGERIGQATTDFNQVLLALNPRSETIRADWHALKDFSDTYGAAAQDIVTTLDAASTTSVTITNHAKQLDALLLHHRLLQQRYQPAGAESGEPDQGRQRARADDEPAVQVQPDVHLHAGRRQVRCWTTAPTTQPAATGKSLIFDAGLSLGNDPYRYPQNLPIVGAKGGPGGKPSCGSLPIVERTGRCVSSSPIPAGAPAWTCGPTRASAFPATPTTSR